LLGGRGEQKNWKTEKTRKKITKKSKPWKKLIKPIKILKKPSGSVYKPKKKKPNRKKLENWAKTEPNRFEPVFILKNQAEPKPVGLKFFFKKFGLVTFFW